MKNIMAKIRNAIYRFMYGRNGVDALSNYLLIVSFVLLIPTVFTDGIVRTIFQLLFWGTIFYSYFRIFSKNIYKRQKENNWFVSKLNYNKQKFSQRKQYRFYDCPKCKTHLRVPKGAGKITITCKKCGYEFDRKA